MWKHNNTDNNFPDISLLVCSFISGFKIVNRWSSLKIKHLSCCHCFSFTLITIHFFSFFLIYPHYPSFTPHYPSLPFILLIQYGCQNLPQKLLSELQLLKTLNFSRIVFSRKYLRVCATRNCAKNAIWSVNVAMETWLCILKRPSLFISHFKVIVIFDRTFSLVSNGNVWKYELMMFAWV